MWRAIYKMTIGRWKYASRNGYDAERFWGDRFRKYGLNLVGPGHDGFSSEENERSYRDAAKVFMEVCRDEGIDLSKSTVLEIGCGTGFYAELFRSAGVTTYQGIDITDVLFSDLRQRFPGFRFLKADIGSGWVPIEGEFSLVTMIDVAQHIVSRERLDAALDAVDRFLTPQGRFIFTTELERTLAVNAFYETQWILNDFLERLRGWSFGPPRPFRDKYLVCATKKGDAHDALTMRLSAHTPKERE
ncbi:MAG: hypothetical protein HBSIN02_01110 [Bacteroidia bacterium]|nr:MAG: hypothetical protein HBSIN02_01110 [Bacteroidia bacterium]